MAHLTTASENETEFGFEKYKFRIARTAIEAALARGARLNDWEYLKEVVGSYYLTPKRPNKYEIAQVVVDDIEDPLSFEITLIIRRGHWEIAKFLQEHAYPRVEFDDRRNLITLTCMCHEEELKLSPQSLPTV